MFRRSSLMNSLVALAAAIGGPGIAPSSTAPRRKARAYRVGAHYAPKPRSRYAEQKQGSSKKRCHHGKKARAQRRRSRLRA